MLALHIISLVALFSVVVYVVVFLIRYKVIPASISVMAEWKGQERWWQVTICTVMGWLGYYFPTVYPFADYGALSIIIDAGVAGLALAGYYSYSSGEESKETLTIHKVGAFAGAILVSIFYLILGSYWILIPFVCAVVLGFLIKGKRLGHKDDNSVVFWCEVALIGSVGVEIVEKVMEV